MVTECMKKSQQQGRSIPQRTTTSSVEESRKALETKDIMPAKVVESTQNINKITQSQYKRVSMAFCSFDD